MIDIIIVTSLSITVLNTYRSTQSCGSTIPCPVLKAIKQKPRIQRKAVFIFSQMSNDKSALAILYIYTIHVKNLIKTVCSSIKIALFIYFLILNIFFKGQAFSICCFSTRHFISTNTDN